MNGKFRIYVIHMMLLNYPNNLIYLSFFHNKTFVIEQQTIEILMTHDLTGRALMQDQ
jgi:hypothetical protein